MGVIGYIVWPRGKLVLRDSDLLWGGRAALGESGSPSGQIATLWSWAQRAVWYKDRGKTCVPCREQPCRPFTFTWVVRCHSQPVNPFWLTRGTPAQQARRRFFHNASWADLERRSPGIKDRVYAWARGEYPNPIPGLADFSAPGQPDVPHNAVVVGGNAFFSEAGTTSWPDDYVRIEKAAPSTSTSVKTVAAVAATAGTAYLLWRFFTGWINAR